MTTLSRRNQLGLALSFILALTAQSASAGPIRIDLVINGGPTISITKGSLLDSSDPFNDDIITANTALLNPIIAGTGLQFSILGGASNNPGDTQARLDQAASAFLLSSFGTVSFTTTIVQNDFSSPVGNGVLQSTLATQFANTPTSSSQALTSYFDQSNSNTGATGTPSGPIGFSSPNLTVPPNNLFSDGVTAPNVPLGSISALYALSNSMDVTLSSGGSGTPTTGYRGSTIVTAAAVPEPSSVVMVMSVLPLAFGLLRRSRKHAGSVG